MKRAIAMFLSLSSAGLIGLSGCGEKKGTTGGSGATDPNAKKPLVGQKENSFAITGSDSTVHVDGKPAESTISITRGSGFDQDVSIEFTGLPPGVKTDPSKLTLAKGAKEVKYTVTAADNAAVGVHPFKVTGKPASGDVSVVDLKVTVKPRASFTLDTPGYALWEAGIKQGETKTYDVGINRETGFQDDVTIKFADLPKGLTIDPASPVIKKDQDSVKVTIKAAPDAAIGKTKLKVTGHPTKGADVTREMKFEVSAK